MVRVPVHPGDSRGRVLASRPVPARQVMHLFERLRPGQVRGVPWFASVILFFLSFLPQFVIAQNGSVSWQIAALGVTFTVQAAILFTLLGYFSGYVGQWLAANRRVGLWLDRLAGAVFVGLGLRLVLAR